MENSLISNHHVLLNATFLISIDSGRAIVSDARDIERFGAHAPLSSTPISSLPLPLEVGF